MKYSWEYKLQCVEYYRAGKEIKIPDGVKPESFKHKVREWSHLFSLHGVDGLKHKSFYKDWTAEERFELVARVLAGKSITSVAIEAGINDGQLYQWVRRYKTSGYEGLELGRRGRPPKDPKPMKKVIDDNKLTPSEKEEFKLLKRRLEYLEAENAYLKKVKALEIKKKALKKSSLSAKAKKQDSSKS